MMFLLILCAAETPQSSTTWWECVRDSEFSLHDMRQCIVPKRLKNSVVEQPIEKMTPEEQFCLARYGVFFDLIRRIGKGNED